MRRSTCVLLTLVLVVGCQATEPRPSPVALLTGTASPAMTSSPQTTPAPTPRRISPFSGEYFTDADLDPPVAALVATLARLYRDPSEVVLDATFVNDGLESAVAYDWRLRGAVMGETAFFGDLALRGKSVVSEQPTADPPSFDADLSIAVAAGAELVDARTRSLLQRWTERQLFTMHVVFDYDVDGGRWRASRIGPADPTFGHPPPTLAPPGRCTDLGPNRPDGSDPKRGRTWCIGGRDGRLATTDVVSVIDDYPCGESEASIVTVGWPIGQPIDGWARYHYVRDPDGRFDREGRLPIAYLADTRLPRDAYSTGLTDGEFELWVSPKMGPKAIWAERTSRIERWPRVVHPWLVIDCN